jgi:hypothetical protein
MISIREHLGTIYKLYDAQIHTILFMNANLFLSCDSLAMLDLLMSFASYATENAPCGKDVKFLVKSDITN